MKAKKLENLQKWELAAYDTFDWSADRNKLPVNLTMNGGEKTILVTVVYRDGRWLIDGIDDQSK